MKLVYLFLLCLFFVLAGCDRTPTPTWASFLSSSDFKQLETELTLISQNFSLTYNREQGFFSDPQKKNQVETSISIEDLASTYFYQDVETWKTNTLLPYTNYLANRKTIESGLARFGFAAKYLSARFTTNTQTKGWTIQDEIPGLIRVLIFDFGGVTRPVSRDESRAWGKSDAELFHLADANLTANTNAINLTEEKVLDGTASYQSYHSDSFLASSAYRLLLQRTLAPSSQGFLVALPNQQDCLVCAVTNNKQALAIDRLQETTTKLFSSRPTPLSKKLFWFQNGSFYPLNQLGEDKATGVKMLEFPVEMKKTLSALLVETRTN